MVQEKEVKQTRLGDLILGQPTESFIGNHLTHWSVRPVGEQPSNYKEQKVAFTKFSLVYSFDGEFLFLQNQL